MDVRLWLSAVALPPLLLAAGLGWWAGQASLALGVGVFLAACVLGMVAIHNFDGVISRRVVARDDQFLFRACEAGSASLRRFYRHLPANPRCRLCLVPFAGLGRWLGVRASRKNANFCQSCIEAAPLGGHEMRAGVLFADIRGFTPYSEANGPTAAAELLSRFYALASEVLTVDDALVELVGDQVMALYLPIFASLRDDAPEVMAAAGRRLQRAFAARDDLLPVGVGLHIGTCSVGNVGKGNEKDFTAVGDVVNTAARLQSRAAAGEIVVSAEVHAGAGSVLAGAKPASLDLKGKQGAFPAYVLPASPA